MRSTSCWWRAGRSMAALRKLALTVALFASASIANAADQPSISSETARAGMTCILSAAKAGVDRSRFKADQNWTPSSNGTDFTHRSMPIAIVFPLDSDGIARICEVRATLPSQDDQVSLGATLASTLKRKPLQQKDSMIWMLGTKSGTRGLQYFPDKQSPQPKVRLIGAAF